MIGGTNSHINIQSNIDNETRPIFYPTVS